MFNNLQDVTLFRRGVMFKGEGRGRVGRLQPWAAPAFIRVIDPRVQICAAKILKIPRIIYLAGL